MNKKSAKKPSIGHVIRSVLSSFFGVQSKKRADVDFQQGQFVIYAITGIIAVIVFIILIMSIVKWVT